MPLRSAIAGSLIGGIDETQELESCAQHNIADIALILADQINKP